MSIDQTAELLRVQPQTIRRRLQAHELTRGEEHGREMVVLRPGDTWIRVEDAAALLGLTSATVRSAIRRGELAGRRNDAGRYRVGLLSVLEHPRCAADAVQLFGGERAPAPEPPEPRPVHRLRRDVHVLLDQDELELLERARELYGSIREAVAAGLRAIDLDGLTPDEVAELRVAHDVHREVAERERARAVAAVARLRERPVETVACIECEELVSIDEAEFVDLEDGAVAIVHAKHGRDRKGRPRKRSVMAQQLRAPEQPLPELESTGGDE